MKPERWQKVDEIFHAALRCQPEERKAFIDKACQGDEELRRELESLLAQESAANAFIEEPAMDIMAKELADDQREAFIGRNIGQYKIISLLGAGGMGEVYRAEDRDLKRQVAVKVLASCFADDRERMARFEREAHLLASLNHPNIAAIYGLQESDGVRALIMELVEGATLADRIAVGPIPLEEALPIALQIAEALEYSHEKGVIHRDLKPANVKLTPEGTVKVLDFGLAKALEDGSTTNDLGKSATGTVATESEVILGTATYMAPEQARGLSVDRRADIWSFGAVFYEMLSGKRLYAGATVGDTLAALLKLEPDWNALPSDVPPRVRRLLRRCLTKDRRERLQAIGEARIEIASYLADPVEEPGQSATRIGTRHKLLLVGSGLALIIASAAVTWRLTTELAPPAPVRLEVALSGDQLTLRLGTYFALSPDGRRLAYIAGRYDNRHLCLRNLDRLEREELVRVESGHTPFFSPDGNWVGFATPSELKKIPVSGGTAVRVCAALDARGASWGPDNIVFAATFPKAPITGLMKVTESGGMPEPVTTLKGKEISHRWPQHLPGGRLVLFTSYESADVNNGKIEVVDLKTGERKMVYSGGTYGRYAASGHLLYVHRNTLFAASFDLRRLEITAKPVPVLTEVTTNGSGGAHFDVSPDGTLVYLSGQDSSALRKQLVWVEPGGKRTAISDQLRNYFWPAIAPDGRRLAVTILEQDNWDVWVHNLERDSQVRLTSHERADFMPVWSPDGRWIAFGSQRDGHSQIYRQMADGSGQPERLLESEYDQRPASFSPNGKYLLFVEQHPESLLDIRVFTLEGERKVEALAISRFNEGSPVFSPDGRWVAYQSDEAGRYEIYLQAFRGGGGKQQISTKGGETPRWSRDGRQLFYRVNNAIMSVAVRTEGNDLQAGVPQAVAETDPSFPSGDFDVAPDGKRFVLIRDDGSARPTLLKFTFHWFEELKRLVPRK